MTDKFTLDAAGNPKPESDPIKRAAWFEKADRRVARTEIGGVTISTVFLSLDHSFCGGPPILWETLVMGGKLDQEQDRCAGSREQDEAMHIRMVLRVKANL